MTRAEELVKRIVTEFKARGYEVNAKLAIDHFTGETVVCWYELYREDRERELRIAETYRHNGTSENVTAKVIVWERVVTSQGGSYPRAKLYETKIPYEASKRVINNRIDKALEKFIYSEPTPVNMDEIYNLCGWS